MSALSPTYSLWQKHLAANPGAPAVIEAASGKVHTRSELNLLAEKLHESLLKLKVHRRLVLIHEPNGIRWLALLLALWRAGAIVLPLDHSIPAQSAHALASDMKGALLWINNDFVKISEQRAIRNKEVALYKMTSGTTGMPKRLAFSEQALLADGQNIIRTMGFEAPDRHFALISFAHSYGFGNLVMPLFLQGCTLVVGSSILPGIILDEIKRTEVSVFSTVPTILSALVRTEAAEDALTGLRLIITAGAPLTKELASAFKQRFGLTPHNFYGSSETGGIAYTQGKTGDDELGEGVGQPLSGVSVTIDSRKRVIITSLAVHLKGRKETTGSRTAVLADKGEIDLHGNLHLHGRLDRIVKLHGRRFDPVEVEAMVKKLPYVVDCFCWVSNASSQEILLVYEGGVEATELAATLSSALPMWKLPRRLRRVTRIPRNTRGKIDLQAMEALFNTPLGKGDDGLQSLYPTQHGR